MTDRRRDGARTVALLTLLFGALTLLFTYPISRTPGTHLNALGDVRLVAWMLAWDAHALVTDPLGLFDANIFFPTQGALAFSENFIGAALAAAPINWAGHPVLAYNLVLMSSFLLSGVGAALWVRHMTGSTAGGVVAGMVWAFAPGKFDQLFHLHMLVGQWIPFALWFYSRYAETGRRRDLFASAVLAAVQFSFSMHLGLYLVLFLALYAGALAILLPSAGSETAPRPRPRGRDLVAVGILFVVLCLPIAVPHWTLTRELDLGRSYGELAAYSAEPASFLAGSLFNRAPHVVWLFERFGAPETRFFPGFSALLLAGAACLWLLPRHAVRAALGTIDPAAGSTRSRMFAGAVIVGGASGLMVLGGALAAYAGGSPGLLTRLCAATSPALVLALTASIALATMPVRATGEAGRRGVYLAVVAYLALIAYLLALGPEVRAAGVDLGYGPYRLAYEVLFPLQGIRAAGRIGILWILFSGALAGFAFAALEERLAGAGRRRFASIDPGWAALALLLPLMVWEYRVWPLPALPADPAQDAIDGWLAEQPGDFAVLHVPVAERGQAWRETRYMLGSTLHWKRLVNGFSGYAPRDYEDLTATAPLSDDFLELVRADFPIRYLLVHGDLLRAAGSRRLERVAGGGRGLRLIDRVDETWVFEVERDRGAGAFVRRRYLAGQLGDANGIRFQMRSPQAAGDDDVIVLAGWGAARAPVRIEALWREHQVPLPAGFAEELRGKPGSFEVRAHRLVPVGGTGGRIAAGLELEVQRGGAGVGFDGRWRYQAEGSGLQVHTFDPSGTRIEESAEFRDDARGALALREHVAALAGDTVVAISIGLGQPHPLSEDAREALRLIGADPPEGEEVSLMVVLGRRGAAPGTAIERVHHQWATIEFDQQPPELELRGISLY